MTPTAGETNGTFEYPKQRQNGECKRRPMDEGSVLTIENREQRPRDRDGSREVTLWRRERVRRGRSLKEES